MRVVLKIFCWNTDDTVWNHWQTVTDNGDELIRAVSQESIEMLLTENQSELEYCFIYLDKENFTEMVESVVQIRFHFPQLKIIVFPNQHSQSAALRLLSQGINGQCNPFIGAEQLKLVRSVVDAGEVWSGKAFIEQLITDNAQLSNRTQIESQQKLSVLSDREKAVAELIAKGLNNKQIAAQLNITDRTVKAHLTATFKKMHIKDRLSLAILVQNSIVNH